MINKIEKIRGQFLKQIRASIRYWLNTESSELEKLEGVAFSILVLIDGMGSMPSFELIPYKQKEGLHFDGQLLHDLFYEEERATNDKQD